MKALLTFSLIAVLVHAVTAATVGSSPAQKPSASAAGSSFLPSFSGDGRTLIFVSHANNLATNDDLGPSLDVFARDLVNSNTVLVSVSTNGVGGANADVQDPVVSHDGRFVAFVSRASNLVASDTNNASDVFVRDIVNGTTRLVSVAITGSSPKDPQPVLNVPLSGSPLISADGRWVVFESRGTNLVVTPTPLNSVNIYARDMRSNVTTLVTVSTNGFALTGTQQLSGISADGSYVAFLSTNLNVVAGVTNSGVDAYVRDLQAEQTIWASRNAALAVSNTYNVKSFALSGDGHYAAMNVSHPYYYYSVAARQDLQNPDAFVKAAFSYASPLQISSNGQYLLYRLYQENKLTVQDLLHETNRDVGWPSYYYTCGGGTGGPLCNQLVDGSFAGQMTPDGRFVAFAIRDDLNGYYLDTPVHIYVRDLLTGASNLVVVTTNGSAKAFKYGVESFAVSPDGQRVAWDSFAADVAANDFNGASDVFVRNIASGTTEIISAPHPQRPALTPLVQSFLTPNSISADGSLVASLRYDDPSASETNHAIDVFVNNVSNGTSVAVSIATNGVYTNLFGQPGSAGDTNTYRTPVISADGSTVAAIRGWGLQAGFLSGAEIAVGRVSNRDYAQMRLVRIAPGETPSLSSDGLLMAFSSSEPSLEPYGADNNFTSDIWLAYFETVPLWYDYKRFFPITAGYGFAGNGPSTSPRMSPDNSRVAFTSRAGNLTAFNAGDSQQAFLNFQVMVNTVGTNRAATNFLLGSMASNLLCSYSAIITHVFEWTDVYDTNSDRTNINFEFVPTEEGATNPVFSGDSHYLFYSLADSSASYRHDLTERHTNIWLFDYQPSAPYAVVRTNVVAGAENLLACTNCRNLSVNADGNLIVFERSRMGSGVMDVFARSLVTGAESLMSVSRMGLPANGTSSSPLISGDGRYVVFQSQASDLVSQDANGASDIFVRDQMLGVTMLVSADAQGQSGNGPSSRPVLAANGRTVVFQSLANDLVANDYNDRRDLLVLTLGSADSDGDGMNDDWEVTYFGNLSHDGNADSDGDGASDLAEFRAGTDPTNLNSAFRVLIVSPAGGASRQLIWSGNPARNYRAEFKDDLGAATWTPVVGTISWNDSVASITDTTAGNSAHRFYRAVILP
jgi:hypothetical protein